MRVTLLRKLWAANTKEGVGICCPTSKRIFFKKRKQGSGGGGCGWADGLPKLGTVEEEENKQQDEGGASVVYLYYLWKEPWTKRRSCVFYSVEASDHNRETAKGRLRKRKRKRRDAIVGSALIIDRPSERECDWCATSL